MIKLAHITKLTLVLVLSTSSLYGEEFDAEELILNSGDKRLTLLELYTSEGCSSCPRADRWLSQHLNNPKLWNEIIPLAFHVDYWDSLGWKDPYASSKNSQRQRQHKRLGNIQGVYTPAIVINGSEWRGLFERTKFPSFDEVPGNLAIRKTGPDVIVAFSGISNSLEAHLVLLGTDIKTNVRTGENAGKLLAHEFVVLSHQLNKKAIRTKESSSGNVVWRFKLPGQNTSTAIAAWVSVRGSQVPVQTVGGWL